MIYIDAKKLGDIVESVTGLVFQDYKFYNISKKYLNQDTVGDVYDLVTAEQEENLKQITEHGYIWLMTNDFEIYPILSTRKINNEEKVFDTYIKAKSYQQDIYSKIKKVREKSQVKPVKQEKEYKDIKKDIGDILPFQDSKILIEPPEKDISKSIISIYSLADTDCNVFERLNYYNIDVSLFKQTYKCPYTHMEFFSLIPMLIITDQVDFYITKMNNYIGEMLNDKEYQWGHYYDEDEDSPYKVSQTLETMIGSGYTCGTMQSDGMNEKKVVAIELSNGDTLICLTFMWYNK